MSVVEKPKVKIPATPGACIDMLKELGERKKKAQKAVDEIEAMETALEAHLVTVLEKMETDAEGEVIVSGKRGKGKLVRDDIPVFAKDGGDEEFYKYVKKNNAFHLLQKRLAVRAIKELWDSGKKVPGITKFIKKKISIVKA